jgi:hypothetical protein
MHDGPEKDKSFFEAEKAPPPPVLSPDMSLFFRSKSVVLSVLTSKNLARISNDDDDDLKTTRRDVISSSDDDIFDEDVIVVVKVEK